MQPCVEMLGFSVYSGDFRKIVPASFTDLKRPVLVTTFNAHAYIVAKRDRFFYDALQRSDILLPDGSGAVLAARLLSKRPIRKIAMYDCFLFQLERLEREGGSCFFLGASQKTLDEIAARLKKDYPGIRAGFYSPPYKETFSEDESREMIKAVNDFAPEVLFVGMTAPKQEKWAFRYRDRLETKMIFAIGANFDFFAGTISRPPEVFIRFHLEWLGRLLNEPRRMWRRVFISLPLFVIEVFAVKFGFKKI